MLSTKPRKLSDVSPCMCLSDLLFVGVAEVEVGGVDPQVAPDVAQHVHVVQGEAGDLRRKVQ